MLRPPPPPAGQGCRRPERGPGRKGGGKINKQGLEVRLLDHNGEGAAPGPSVPSLERPDEGPAGDMVPLEVAPSRLESQRRGHQASSVAKVEHGAGHAQKELLI